MAQYKTCPYCGASLDPAERCDCNKEKELPVKTTPQERTREIVFASGNKWATENLNATH